MWSRRRPTGLPPAERDNCLPYLAEELEIMTAVRVLVCLGSFAWDAALRVLAGAGHWARPKPRFGHGACAEVGPYTLVGCYHPSQQNTFTGVLTPDMIDDVLTTAARRAGG